MLRHISVSRTFLCPTHIPPHQGLFWFCSERGQYLLLKLTHLPAKVFGSFWCCFFFEFPGMVQPSFRAFAKLSTYSQFQALSLLIFSSFLLSCCKSSQFFIHSSTEQQNRYWQKSPLLTYVFSTLLNAKKQHFSSAELKRCFSYWFLFKTLPWISHQSPIFPNNI